MNNLSLIKNRNKNKTISATVFNVALSKIYKTRMADYQQLVKECLKGRLQHSRSFMSFFAEQMLVFVIVIPNHWQMRKTYFRKDL